MTEFNLDNQKCSQCGLCCKYIAEEDFYLRSDLTKEQFVKLEIKETNKGVCGALAKEDDKYVCLVHKLFGQKAKASQCRDYPSDGSPCIKDKSPAFVIEAINKEKYIPALALKIGKTVEETEEIVNNKVIRR